MNIKDSISSRYLVAETDIPDEEDLVLTIKDAVMEQLGTGADASEKIVLYFKETKKGLALNKTNLKSIAKVLNSDETDDWIGKRIALFATEVDFRGDQVLAIRVRLKAPRGPARPAQAEDATSSDPFADEA